MWAELGQHLEVSVYGSDLSEFFSKKELHAITYHERFEHNCLIRLFLDNLEMPCIIKERAITQLGFRWDEYGNNIPYFAERGAFDFDYVILGYDYILDEKTFKKCIQEIEDVNDMRFWARGIQFDCQFDRAHFHYLPDNGEVLSGKNNLIYDSYIRKTFYEPICEILKDILL